MAAAVHILNMFANMLTHSTHNKSTVLFLPGIHSTDFHPKINTYHYSGQSCGSHWFPCKQCWRARGHLHPWVNRPSTWSVLVKQNLMMVSGSGREEIHDRRFLPMISRIVMRHRFINLLGFPVLESILASTGQASKTFRNQTVIWQSWKES